MCVSYGILSFLGGFDDKESAHSAEDLGPILGQNGHPFQYSCLENPKNRGAWWAIVHGVAKSQTLLSDYTFKGQKS